MPFIRYFRTFLAVGIMLLSLQACTGGHFRVSRVAGGPQADNAEGFRYFLPKPYLLVTNMTVLATPVAAAKPESPEKPGQSAKPGEKDKPDSATKEGSAVSVQLLWLPDMKQQFAVSIEGGRGGTFKGSLQLENGWMLVGINQEFDTKTAETLNAITGSLKTLLGAAGLPTPKFEAQPATLTQSKPFLYLFAVDLENQKLEMVNSDALRKALEAEGLHP